MFGWVGLLFGLVGIAVAIYFGLTSKRRRELVFSVNPVRTRVVTAGQATDLQVLYRDEPLGSIDITAVQLAIWNDGNESIKTEHIREETKQISKETGHIRREIVVTTKPQVRILEASVRTGSPDTGFNLLDSTDSKAKGRVPVSWGILEKNRGASIQLLYLGTPEVDILVEGLIEGQGHAKRIVTSSSFKSPQAHRKSLRGQSLFAAISFLVLLVTAVLKFAFQMQGPGDIISLLFVLSAGSLLIAVLGLASTMRERYPPFGF